MFFVRALLPSDLPQLIDIIDQQGNNEIITWLLDCEEDDCENDYSYGVFDNDTLVGICTIGGADDCDEFENHPKFTWESYLLSDVYLLPAYRGKGLTSILLSKAIELKRQSSGEGSVFLSAICQAVANVYTHIGFSPISENSMNMVYNF